MEQAVAIKLANRIANDLFINGNKEKAERLVLISSDKRDLGGWSKQAVVDRIMLLLMDSESIHEK